MKRYTRKKVGGTGKPKGFKKFDVVHVLHPRRFKTALL